jgi:hypothetical protein
MYDPKPQNRSRREARNPRKLNQASNITPIMVSTPVQPKQMPPAEQQAMQEQQPNDSGARATKLGSRSHENDKSSSSSDKKHHQAKPSTAVDQNQAKHGEPGTETEAEWEVLDDPNDPVRAEKERKENEAANKLIDDLDNMFRPSATKEVLENWKRMKNQ